MDEALGKQVKRPAGKRRFAFRDLLDPAGTEYAVDSARDIFVHWILGVELKF